MPLLARLDVRRGDVPRVPRRQGRSFRTKLEQADGFYAKRPFQCAASAAGVPVVSRLRRDAALRTVPAPPRGRRPRGGPPTYGPGRISLVKRAGPRRGWRVVRARQYGEDRDKCVKSFLATWRAA